MRVILSPSQWKELRVEQEPEFVRAAFYLGYSMLYIINNVGYVSSLEEREDIIQTAKELGMNDEDVLIQSSSMKGP